MTPRRDPFAWLLWLVWSLAAINVLSQIAR